MGTRFSKDEALRLVKVLTELSKIDGLGIGRVDVNEGEVAEEKEEE